MHYDERALLYFAIFARDSLLDNNTLDNNNHKNITNTKRLRYNFAIHCNVFRNGLHFKQWFEVKQNTILLLSKQWTNHIAVNKSVHFFMCSDSSNQIHLLVCTAFDIRRRTLSNQSKAAYLMIRCKILFFDWLRNIVRRMSDAVWI